MLSVGGIDVDLSFPESFFNPDRWKNGLGVLDLTTLTWGTRYDATARPYESPEVVRQWYASGGLASVKWTSDTVRRMFAQAAPPGTMSDPTKRPTDDRPLTGTPDPQDLNNGEGSSPSNNTNSTLLAASWAASWDFLSCSDSVFGGSGRDTKSPTMPLGLEKNTRDHPM